jgi:hypothetical protein
MVISDHTAKVLLLFKVRKLKYLILPVIPRQLFIIMTIHRQSKDYFKKSYRITEELQQAAVQVLSDFFDYMHLQNARQALADMLEVALITSSEKFDQPVQRANAIYFCKKLEELTEAAYVLTLSNGVESKSTIKAVVK